MRVPVIFALLAACSFDARLAGDGFRCDGEHACPGGTVCADGVCRRAGSPGSDGGDSGDRDGAAGEVDAGFSTSIIERACPGQILDQDAFDFESTTRWYWFVNGDGEMGAVAGVARAQLYATNARAGLVSTGTYPLADTAFAFRLPEPSAEDNTYVALEIISQDEETPFFTIYRSDQLITAEHTDLGMTGVVLDERLYDRDTDRVWRIRHQDGAITWETAPDALAWTSLTSQIASPDLPDLIRLRILIETNDTSTAYQQDFDDMVVCTLR